MYTCRYWKCVHVTDVAFESVRFLAGNIYIEYTNKNVCSSQLHEMRREWGIERERERKSERKALYSQMKRRIARAKRNGCVDLLHAWHWKMGILHTHPATFYAYELF